METRVQRWGNSLAVRIPKAFALEAGLGDNTRVALSLVNGTLLIVPIPITTYSLDTLLAGVTDQNVHAAVDSGPAVGEEAR
ncbi:MAG: AbrB/MazE/SpoVT family DNA-binding domain-containing protein [Chloroflexota bacterium]